MDNIILYNPGKSRETSSARVDQDVQAILKGFPQGEEDWADVKPQSELEITALFNQLTLTHIPSTDRALMPCERLLQNFADNVNPECPLHVATFTAACVVGMRLGKLSGKIVQGIMRSCLDDNDRMLAGKRSGVLRFILFHDILHRSEAFGGRTYELPLRRKPFLNQAAHLTSRHFQYLRRCLASKESDTIYKPMSPLDSTRLRIPDLIFELYAGRFTREEVENAFRMPENPPLDAFFTFFPLDQAFKKFQQEASKEIVHMVPPKKLERLDCFGLPDPCPELLGFVKMQSATVSNLTAEHRMNVIDIEGPQGCAPEAFRLDAGASIRVAEGFLGLAVLLHDHQIDMIITPDDVNVIWKPGQVLCYTGKGIKAKDDRNRIYFLLAQLEVKPI